MHSSLFIHKHLAAFNHKTSQKQQERSEFFIRIWIILTSYLNGEAFLRHIFLSKPQEHVCAGDRP